MGDHGPTGLSLLQVPPDLVRLELPGTNESRLQFECECGSVSLPAEDGSAGGVSFDLRCFRSTTGNETRVDHIRHVRDGKPGHIAIGEHDCVFTTLGSMTAGSTLGSMTSAPSRGAQPSKGSWALWHTIARDRPEFGQPSVFDGNVEQSLWESFSVTFDDPLFFRMMQEFSGNEAGTGGLVTFKDSNWLMSVVLPHQPHYLKQPEGVTVWAPRS